jgi:hypothetical protein
VTIVMEFGTLFKRAMLGTLLAGATAMAGDSNRAIIKSAKAMEGQLGLTITTRFEMGRSIRRTQQIPNGYTLLGPSISPDGTALAWSSYRVPALEEEIPFLTVTTLADGTQPVRVEGRVAVGSGLSSRAEVIVAIGIPLDVREGRRRELLTIDRRDGGAVHDLTRSVTQFELGNNLEVISVSGPGTLVALGEREREQIQVLEIPSGKTVYAGRGRFPRLSPDGTRLAFVNKEMIWIYSFTDGSTKQLLKVKPVKGLGGWSPDGRFLLAGAWTTSLALEKRQIIIDTAIGEYAVIGQLPEGDYGSQFAWISVKLLER